MDIQIVPDKTGEIQFSVVGKADDYGLMLLQRLYILLLSDQSKAYRGADNGYALMSFLKGGNVPPDGVISSVLAVCCAVTLRLLDAEDRNNISEFVGYGEDGKLKFTLTLKDGTTIHSELQHV